MTVTQAELKYLHETLEQLSTENAVVHAAVTMCNIGTCTFDQAMLWAVIELAKQNKTLQDKLLQEVQRRPPPMRGSL